ncbi:hypothetical protein ACJMK2_028323 [Sinanodonta woodiana]|uniref:Uncharacterized protein n=1 Tax=Sinanodonta woodiana TaxID=1069815 RepID=A0ABD3X6R3_SINWO
MFNWFVTLFHMLPRLIDLACCLFKANIFTYLLLQMDNLEQGRDAKEDGDLESTKLGGALQQSFLHESENQSYSPVIAGVCEKQDYSVVSEQSGIQLQVPFTKSTEASMPRNKREIKLSRRFIIITSVIAVLGLGCLISFTVYFVTKASTCEISRTDDFKASTNEVSRTDDFKTSTTEVSTAGDFKASTSEVSMAEDFNASKSKVSRTDDFKASTSKVSTAEDFKASTIKVSTAEDFKASKSKVSRTNDFKASTTEVSTAEDFKASKSEVSRTDDFKEYKLTLCIFFSIDD